MINSKGRCEVQLQSRNSSFKIFVSVIIVSNIPQLLPSRSVKIHNVENIRKLMLAEPFFLYIRNYCYENWDVLPFINREGMQTFEGCLEARAFHFGWNISGPTPSESVRSFSTTGADNSEICTLLKKFWELEEVEPPKTTSDSDSEEFHHSITTRDKDGRNSCHLKRRFLKIFFYFLLLYKSLSCF